jgi:hypothetical protein
MANVQLENGHIRIANRLFEAILYADFTDTQRLIVMVLIRLTYGWHRHTATVSMAQLATYCRCQIASNGQPSGSFRRAFGDLTKRGVVRVLQHGEGPLTSVLAIEKDFTKWGRYGTSEGCLADIYGERPVHADHMLADMEEGAPLWPVPQSPRGQATSPPKASPPVPTGNDPQSPRGLAPSPPEDCLRAPKFFSGEIYEVGKTLKDNIKITTTTTASSAAARARVRARLIGVRGEQVADDALDSFAELVGERQETWWALLNGYAEGLGTPKGKAASPEAILTAMLEFRAILTPGQTANPRHFVAFLADLMSGRRDQVLEPSTTRQFTGRKLTAGDKTFLNGCDVFNLPIPQPT